MYANQLDFYQKEIQSQWNATSWMISGGLHIDTVALIRHRQEILDAIRANEASLQASLGWTPNTKSPLDMERLFLSIGVVAQRTKKSNKVKMARDDLLNYAHRFSSARSVLATCLEITRLRTLQSNFLEFALDGNNYYHPTYRLNGTATGRYASQGADEGGPQAQNIPHELLDIVIPDNPGDVLTEADLKQAEAMIVVWDAQDMVALDAFQRDVDAHRVSGCWIFRNWEYSRGIPPKQLLDSITVVCPNCRNLGLSKCDHSERHIAKTGRYEFTYKGGPRKFVQKILPKAGVYITEAEGKRIRDRVVSPPVVKWQDNTDLELRKSRWLTNLLGRKREFYGLLDDNGELLRAALSWKAQSVVGVIAGRAVSRLERSLRSIGPNTRLLTQRHDSVLVSHREADSERVKQVLADAFYSPINAHGRILNIPIEIKTGPNWRDLH